MFADRKEPLMYKNERRYNPFDNFLFWLDLASIDFSSGDFSFGLNEIPQNGINNNYPHLKHIEKPVSGKPPEENTRRQNDS
jgi:hypothetical protein